MNQRTFLSHLVRLCGIVILLAILLNVDIAKMAVVAQRISPVACIVGIVLVVITLVLRGLRWYTVAQGLDLRLRPLEAIDGLCIAQVMGFILPGTLGDLIRVPYLKCRGNPSYRSIMSVFLDALLAASVFYAAGAVSVFVLIGPSVSLFVAVGSVSVVLVIGLYAVFYVVKERAAPWLVQTRLRKIQGTGMSGRLFVSAGVILSDVGIRRLAIGIVLSAGAWFTYTLLAWQLGLALGIGLPWNTMAMVATLASMISTVPVSVQGLGVRESVFLLLLGSMGIDYEITIAFSLLLMAMSLVPSVWGLVSWQRDPFVRIGPEKLEEAIVEPIELVHERD